MQKAFTAPDWFIKSGAIYQINPRTFSAEGTIKAVTKELPFLADLGFGTMYLCPIFKEDDSLDNWSKRQIKSNTGNPKNPYRISDYFEIDSEYGLMDDLREFVRESHRLNMKVMLDLVFLHIGPNASIIKEHPEFVQHNADGTVRCTEWNFPYLNYECEGLREYLYANMVYYIGVIGVDGFRCDVGDSVPHDFWTEGRRRMRTIKPDAILLNEGSKAELLGVCFDAMYSFGWHEAMYSVVSGQSDVALLREKWSILSQKMPDGGAVMRDIDNHDTVTDWPSRAEVAAGHDGMEAALTVTYLIDGAPMVYCGNELADQKRLNMFANRFFMGDFEVTDRDDKASEASLRRQGVIKKLNTLRRESETLARGTTEWLDTEHPDKVVCFKRALNGEEITVIANLSRETVTVTVPNAGNTVILESKSTREGDKFILNPLGYEVLSNI